MTVPRNWDVTSTRRLKQMGL